LPVPVTVTNPVTPLPLAKSVWIVPLGKGKGAVTIPDPDGNGPIVEFPAGKGGRLVEEVVTAEAAAAVMVKAGVDDGVGEEDEGKGVMLTAEVIAGEGSLGGGGGGTLEMIMVVGAGGSGAASVDCG
jgi:hypothetical protein